MENIKREKLKEIFREFRSGNKMLYEVLYKEYYSIVYGVVFSIVKNKETSEDIVQEIFLKIYNLEKEKFPETGELSWLYTVSKNETLGYLRRKKQEVNIEEVYELSDDSNDIESLIDMQTYKKMITGLNKQEQEIISLKVLSNFTFKSIGQMLSMPTATVQWKYYKAVSSLRISLANFAGAILACILFIGRRIGLEKKNENLNKNENYTIDNSNSFIQSESSGEKESTDNKQIYGEFYLPNGETSNISNKVTSTYGMSLVFENLKDIDMIQPILISASGVFLVISIIYAIFFKNHQQKRKRKASKIM